MLKAESWDQLNFEIIKSDIDHIFVLLVLIWFYSKISLDIIFLLPYPIRHLCGRKSSAFQGFERIPL